jgi:glycosyltransferase involved in cell wall biosynthesis
VSNAGFVQPDGQPEILARHGVFVLASRFEPWGVAIAEACAAGLPVIHSEACGAAVELVRPYFNGVGVATENAAALTAAMRWCHDHHSELPEMGARSQPLAAAYSADAWADRWTQMFQELCDVG